MIKTFIKKNKESINFYLVILLIGSVVYFGPKFSKWYEKYEIKNIDKNGKLVRGCVINFYYSKSGSTLKVEYEYRTNKYYHKELKYNKKLEINDYVYLMIDTLDPENAYIVNFDSE